MSCYLRCHFSAAFACGLLNSQPFGFYSPSAIVQDVRRHGVVVLPVDVQTSEVDFSLMLPKQDALEIRRASPSSQPLPSRGGGAG